MRITVIPHETQLQLTVEDSAVSHRSEHSFDPDAIEDLSAEIRQLLARNNMSRAAGDAGALKELGARLFERLLSCAARDKLGPHGGSLVLHMDSSLVGIPWEICHDGDQFLCRRYDLIRQVVTTHATGSPGRTIPPVGSRRMLIVCSDPKGDLPDVVREGESLAEYFDSESSIEADLLVTPAREQLRRRIGAYDLVHFAGHAQYSESEESGIGWLLKDGVFSASDVAQLSRSRALPSIVFGNACKSGKCGNWREGASSYGIVNAFLVGGVGVYVGTQWDVQDRLGPTVAKAFYRALGRGAPAAMALRVARKAIVGATDENNLQWAAYVVFGDPAFSLVSETTFDSAHYLRAAPIASRLPRKRIADSGLLAPSGARSESNKRKIGRRIHWGLRVVLALLLVGVVGMGAVYFGRAPRSPASEANSSSDGNGSSGAGIVLSAGQRAAPGQIERARVAVMIGSSHDPLQQCVRRMLQASRHFRPLTPAQRADMPPITSTLDSETLIAAARRVDAELVLRTIGSELRKVVVIDVLTGEQALEHIPRDKKACDLLLVDMNRVFLGQGRVVDVHGSEATINLGWRSRAAPGALVTIRRGNKTLATARVLTVQMDTARVSLVKRADVRPDDEAVLVH